MSALSTPQSLQMKLPKQTTRQILLAIDLHRSPHIRRNCVLQRSIIHAEPLTPAHTEQVPNITSAGCAFDSGKDREGRRQLQNLEHPRSAQSCNTMMPCNEWVSQYSLFDASKIAHSIRSTCMRQLVSSTIPEDYTVSSAKDQSARLGLNLSCISRQVFLALQTMSRPIGCSHWLHVKNIPRTLLAIDLFGRPRDARQTPIVGTSQYRGSGYLPDYVVCLTPRQEGILPTGFWMS